MVQIFTARGLIIRADEADVDLLLDYSWYACPVAGGRFYAQAHVRGVPGHSRISMHRLLMQPAPGMVVHHVNNDGLDNRRQNLMVMTQAQNLAAYHHPRRSGVYASEGRFRAGIRINKKRLFLGIYDDEEDAHAAVRAARNTASHETFP